MLPASLPVWRLPPIPPADQPQPTLLLYPPPRPLLTPSALPTWYKKSTTIPSMPLLQMCPSSSFLSVTISAGYCGCSSHPSPAYLREWLLQCILQMCKQLDAGSTCQNSSFCWVFSKFVLFIFFNSIMHLFKKWRGLGGEGHSNWAFGPSLWKDLGTLKQLILDTAKHCIWVILEKDLKILKNTNIVF